MTVRIKFCGEESRELSLSPAQVLRNVTKSAVTGFFAIDGGVFFILDARPDLAGASKQ
jgi:hypothetical protein